MEKSQSRVNRTAKMEQQTWDQYHRVAPLLGYDDRSNVLRQIGEVLLPEIQSPISLHDLARAARRLSRDSARRRAPVPPSTPS